MRPMRLAVAALAALALLAATAGGAQAKVVKLTGSTTVTPTSQVTGFLSANGVSVSPTGSATAGGGSFTFPVANGFGNPKTYNGVLAHSGGLKFAKGSLSVTAQRFVAVRYRGRGYVLAQVPGLRGGCASVRRALVRFSVKHPRAGKRARKRVRRLARRYPRAANRAVRALRDYCRGGRVIVLGRLRNQSASVSGSTATLKADLRLTRQTTRLVNKALGTSIPRGVLLGSATSTVTTAP